MFYKKSALDFNFRNFGFAYPETLRLIIIALLLSAISACQVSPSKPSKPEPSELTIEQLIKDKDTSEAIATLDRMAAKTNRSKAFDYMYKAAELSIGFENPVNVDNRLQQLTSIYPEHDKYVRISILRARIALSAKQPDAALKTLQSILSSAKGSETLEILDLKASSLAQAGFPLESIQVRIQLDQQLQTQQADPALVENNDREIWKDLMQVSPGLISAQITEIPDTFSGWLELAHFANSYQYDQLRLNNEIDAWLKRHPEHPATRHIVETIRLRQIATSQHPDHIALVLPLTGKLAAAGKAIRDGFLAAYFESAAAIGMNVKIDILDTAGQPDLATFAVRQAEQSGAKFIVGPLDKNAVSAVTGLTDISSQILVLNQIPVDPFVEPAAAAPLAIEENTEVTAKAEAQIDRVQAQAQPDLLPASRPEIYQFTLAPEDEGSQVADRASLDQYFNAMAIVPENVWGNRIYEAFAERYNSLGGGILTKQTYKKGSADHSTIIQNGLNLTKSNIRFQQLKGFLRGNIEFTPRRRQDIDMIFLVAHPQDARQIKPQLEFYYAADIPVYSTSHIFTGMASPKQDKDLDGIRFCDMPWVLSPGQDASTQAFNTLSGDNRQFIRLYALGVDVFRLIPHLPWLEDHPGDWIAGQTGRLSLAPDRSVIRRVSWTRFVDGLPETTLTPTPL